MIAWLSQYKKSAILAMICGLVTVALGLAAAGGQAQSVAAVAIVMVINTALHYESYFVTKLVEHRKNTNVLTMAIAETILLSFFALRLQDWQEFSLVFAVYLVFNGTSLMGIPSAFARYCGILAAALGAILYFFGREPGTMAWVITGINLIVNGAERIVMSALGGKKKRS